jgi:hypothetical protein
LVSTTLAAKLPPVSTTLLANLPPVSGMPMAKFATSFASVVDTGGKFATSVNNTGGKFATDVNKTSGNLPPSSTTPNSTTQRCTKVRTGNISEDREHCIGVVRAEHGSIREIGFMVTDMLDGVALAPGSVILVGSVSDLAKQGVSGYTEELARTVRILREEQGPNVQVDILPPVLLGGVDSFNLLRGIVEVET